MTRKEKLVSGILKQVRQQGTNTVKDTARALSRLAQEAFELEDHEIDLAMTVVHRMYYPEERGDSIWRYTRNGGTKSEKTCRICGCYTSWCTKYRRPMCSYRTESKDIKGHVEEVRKELRRLLILR